MDTATVNVEGAADAGYRAHHDSPEAGDGSYVRQAAVAVAVD